MHDYGQRKLQNLYHMIYICLIQFNADVCYSHKEVTFTDSLVLQLLFYDHICHGHSNGA